MTGEHWIAIGAAVLSTARLLWIMSMLPPPAASDPPMARWERRRRDQLRRDLRRSILTRV